MKGQLHIQAALRSGKTYLKHAYYSTPFRVADITEDKKAPQLTLMLITSSPGVLDGDNYEIQVDVLEGSAVELQTQSYQRLFTMQHGASQLMKVKLLPNSSFCFIPHPTVPHQSSSFTARNKIYLTTGCLLVWGEVLTCGRKLSGEEFLFTEYHSITEIFYDERLVVKENLLIQPGVSDVTAIGQLEGYTHQASLICIDNRINTTIITTAILTHLHPYDKLCFGVTSLPINGILVRVIGFSGDQLHRLLKEISELVQSIIAASTELITKPIQEYAS